MTERTATLVAAMVAVVLGATLTGCTSPPPASQETNGGSVSATSSVEGTDASPAVLPDGSSGTSQAEIKAVDQQLNAMQKELDSLKMPTDNDFESAEGALY